MLRRILAAACLMAVPAAALAQKSPDLSKEKVLYVVPYAHLDTQWRWDYATTINQFIKNTLDQNFALFEKYPDYRFTFTGAIRYEMMKEYYPERFEKLKDYVRQGRWRVGGSSMEEGDVNVPSPESVIRQVLYGNHWFQKELGVESVDYMLPDCFGFQASMPSIWAHCGLKGFSTQKLTWGSAAGIPFPLGVWEGPDGKGVICAFDPGAYVAGVDRRLDTDKNWADRVDNNGKKYGVYADYHYFGVGDQGGAPREHDVDMACKSLNNPDGQIKVEIASSDQMFRDITPEQAKNLPRYKGDLLLTQHSAGSITSQAYMKRWNRKNELLADSAERAAVAAYWLGAQDYPQARINSAWTRVLGSQFHDILPGTSLPKAYEYSWNDEVLAMNIFGQVLERSAGATIRSLDTHVQGIPVVVYNPLAAQRQDVVEASIDFSGPAPANVSVFGPDGKEVPSQVEKDTSGSAKVLFLANVKPVSFTVYEVKRSTKAAPNSPLKISRNSLENADYLVKIDDNGDVCSIIDKRNGGKKLLSGPAQLQFLYENPREYPAWNMDWQDRQKPPMDVVSGPAKIRIVENGPVRVALEIVREARNSIFTQQVRLTAGTPGRRVEFKTHIDWQSTGCSLKQAFPLSVSDSFATYNLGLGTIQRGNNDERKYEVPSRQWFDLTDLGGAYGVSVLEDCKFGSDKPADNTLRLTLLHTPNVGNDFRDQYSQDWGRHDIVYALYGHKGDWRAGVSELQGLRVNQPLVGFQTGRHAGNLGRRFSVVSVSTPQVDIRALKKAEDSGYIIVRLQELLGKPASQVKVTFASPIEEAFEVNGQEERVGPATVAGGKLVVNMTPFSPRTFAVRPARPAKKAAAVVVKPVALPFDQDIISTDANRSDGGIDSEGRTLPAEQLQGPVACEGVKFRLGSTKDGEKNALSANGQSVALPQGRFDRVYLLLTSAAEGKSLAWTGFIGQYDNRVWDRDFGNIEFRADGKVTAMTPAYIRRDPVAWFCTHRHHPRRGNEAYQFSYLYIKSYTIKPGAKAFKLPANPDLKVLAMTVTSGEGDAVRAVQPLYDDFSGWGPLKLRQ